ncbi:MAG: FeoA family protein [Eubacteriaceae bacterium]
MALTVAPKGDFFTISRITGREKTRQFLKTLGFTEGEKVSVISELGGNMIVSVRNSRIALDRDMARRIQVAL